MSVSLGTATECASHPGVLAAGTCPRCGAFTCEHCVSSPFYKEHCPRCVAKLTEKASTRSIAAVAFAGLSIGCYCLPLGFVAFILGHSELAAIDRGESAESGRSYAQAARIIGAISSVLTIVIGLIVGISALVGAAQ